MNYRISVILFVSLFLFGKVYSQDTFSIVAADSVTREVGSAGASCVDLFVSLFPDPAFLGDLLPDLGAINTQASYDETNQKNARARMLAGDSPSQIINWLTANDVAFNPTQRQYGIVGFTGKSVSAAGYTGTNCYNYKNHKTGNIQGFYYSIQGNILLGQSIIDSMESKFRNTNGDLAKRLMAALQGAKVVGADSRCASNGSSSLFAFVKVSKPLDSYNSPFFKVTYKTHSGDKIEPIDTLQKMFDSLYNLTSIQDNQGIVNEYAIYPNPSTDYIILRTRPQESASNIEILDVFGNRALSIEIIGELPMQRIDISALPAGVYFVRNENKIINFVKN